jgi:methylenetetrahydrofolate--tRNA-(uracil-5-)-methyltransferase
MNVNFGLFPPISVPRQPRGPKGPKAPRSGKAFERKRAMANRALADLEQWLGGPAAVAAE